MIAEDYNEDVHKLAKEYEGIIPLTADITEENSAKYAVQLAVDKFGKLRCSGLIMPGV